MRILASIVFTFTLSLPSCGDDANAAMNKAQQMAAEAAAAAQQLAATQTTFGDLARLLGGITDGASAAKAKEQLTALVARMQTQFGAGGDLAQLGNQLGAAANGMMRSALDQATKLAGDPAVRQAIGPTLDQLKALLAGK